MEDHLANKLRTYADEEESKEEEKIAQKQRDFDRKKLNHLKEMAGFFQLNLQQHKKFGITKTLDATKRNSDIQVVSIDSPPPDANPDNVKINAKARVKFITQLPSDDSDDSQELRDLNEKCLFLTKDMILNRCKTVRN